MSARTRRGIAAVVTLVLALGVVACDDSDDGGTNGAEGGTEIDYEAVGLWDDGACDESLAPLVVGISSVYQSPVISLGDQVLALEAAAVAFNARGGANGACIEVHTCDDGADIEQSMACVRELDEAGIVATINELTTAGNEEVAVALSEAGIPRVATNVSPSDWADPNAFPIDASSTGSTFMMPQSLVEEDVTEIGVIRADLAQASALAGILGGMYEDEGVEFVTDTPVPPGATDHAQFILAAETAGAGGVILAVGEQEAMQVVQAAGQVGTEMLLAATLGTFPHEAVAGLGDIAEQMVFLSSFPPATFMDLPAYEVMRADLAASEEEDLQATNLKANSVRSWIGLYALLSMIRDAGMTEFTREGITSMLQSATDVPMLGIFGDETWTPDLNHAGAFSRAGINQWGIYRWDPGADAPGGLEGNFVESTTIRFDEVLCGSPFGAPEPC